MTVSVPITLALQRAETGGSLVLTGCQPSSSFSEQSCLKKKKKRKKKPVVIEPSIGINMLTPMYVYSTHVNTHMHTHRHTPPQSRTHKINKTKTKISLDHRNGILKVDGCK